MHFFTSITTSYLPKARVLAKSLKKYNPDAVMHLVIADDLPFDFNLENEPFDYIWKAEDFIKTENNAKWFFMHNVVELCTAIKGAAALHILKETGTNKLIYLDPDIAVFDNLSELSFMLDNNSLLLTPHQIEPATDFKGVEDEEICSLKHGIYNFGFFAVKNDDNGMKFLNWWNSRLMNFCYDDIPNGLFTDQKWGDLIPALFEFVKIIRTPEYNVATWNLATRKIEGDEIKGWKVNGRALKFYHFTGFDSGAHRIVLSHYAKQNDPVWNLSLWYEKQIYENGQAELGKSIFKYARYKNGKQILREHRAIFRKRQDLYDYFDNPFCDECCCWMEANCGKKVQNVIDIFYNMFKFKLLYKFSVFNARSRNKKMYKYYKGQLDRVQNVIDSVPL